MARKLALCIGINDYPGTGSDLRGCVNDARDWQTILATRGFDCTLLLDGQATGQAIRDGMTALAAESVAGDIVVIVYAGHGSVTPDLDGDEADGNDECWCPHDVAVNGVITDDELNTIFQRRKEGVRWVIISDSCNSGTVVRKSPLDAIAKDGLSDTRAPRPRFLPPTAFASESVVFRGGSVGMREFHASAPGRRGPLLLAGCQDDQSSMDAYFNGRPNGAFTYSALQALKQLPPDATYEEWYVKIREFLPSQDFKQVPNLYDVSNHRRKWLVLAAEGEKPGDSAPRATADGDIQDALNLGKRNAASVIASTSRARATSRAQRKFLIAEGDSWFDIPVFRDTVDALENTYGYDVVSVARFGHTVEAMAYFSDQKSDFYTQLRKMGERGEEPCVVLLSAGGNDIAGPQLSLMINPRQSSQPGVNRAILDEFVNHRLRNAYFTLIAAITEYCKDAFGKEIPILVHGYAYAWPDGRRFGWLPFPGTGPWLEPAFAQQGYTNLTTTKAMVRELIDAFNEMLQSLPATPATRHVHYLNLRDLFPPDSNHAHWWNDELHPTAEGFDFVAGKFVAAISSVAPGC